MCAESHRSYRGILLAGGYRNLTIARAKLSGQQRRRIRPPQNVDSLFRPPQQNPPGFRSHGRVTASQMNLLRLKPSTLWSNFRGKMDGSRWRAVWRRQWCD